MTAEALRGLLRETFAEALRGLCFDELTAAHLREVQPAGQVLLLAAGKGAVSMARGAARAWGDRLAGGLVVSNTAAQGLPKSLQVLQAAHPVPDESSKAAADAALGLARSAHAGSTLLVLVSGGASSLLCAPPEGLSLREKMRLVSELLRSGASIHEVNTVRRHVSRIKGGRLAAATRARVHLVVASDVIGGEAHDVGSGPASADPTTVGDAWEVARRVLAAEDQARLAPHLSEGLRPDAPAAARIATHMLVRPEALAEAVAAQLRARGVKASGGVVAHCTEHELAVKMLAAAQALASREAWVACCEPTVRLAARAGAGGRAGRVALRLMLEPAFPDDCAALCGASDGADGSSGTAGACVSKDALQAVERAWAEAKLADYSDASVHAAAETSLITGATGINLTDVYVVVRG